MIKKTHRLSTKEFMEVMEKGRIYHSPLFILRAIMAQGSIKISAVAPKKIAPTAVARNKVRRRIYSVVRPLLTTIPQGTRAIIFAKAEAIKAEANKSDLKAVSADLKTLFAKARIGV